MTKKISRREFVEDVAVVASAVGAAGLGACTPAAKSPSTAVTTGGNQAEEKVLGSVPVQEPDQWDAVAFNRARGNSGAIPVSYLDKVNGPEGTTGHLGKHLPFVVQDGATRKGYLSVMWGDPSKGYAAHPNAAPSEENPEGHFYNWIRIRKATQDSAREVESTFTSWPNVAEQDNGKYAVRGGGDIESDSGKNTIYMAELPKDVEPGDRIRVWAHCLTHGEYIDFLTVPA